MAGKETVADGDGQEAEEHDDVAASRGPSSVSALSLFDRPDVGAAGAEQVGDVLALTVTNVT